ncbi:MAG TPA: hypothetical protein VK404_08930 [Spirosoma sp.]|nr:hypothetical protein [Spirosoma sp.]
MTDFVRNGRAAFGKHTHLNLSTKEIAALLTIDPASVRTAKTRLYKKMAAADNGLALKPADEQTNEPTDGA